MSSTPTAAVLIIGNEILSGKTQDTNVAFLGRSLAALGIRLLEARVVRDEPPVIADVVNVLRASHTYVFTTGGIGPTHDDLTAESIARAFGVSLVLDDEAKRRIGHGGRELNEARLKMAMIPEGASLIDNPISHAPGFRIDNVFVLAGIPSVAKAMFESIAHELGGGPPILSDSVDLFVRESDIAAPLDAIARANPEVEIGSYPFARDGRYGAAIVVRGTDRASVSRVISEINSRFRRS
jgi:molybdenum cofactor synthesis domain-containing protein